MKRSRLHVHRGQSLIEILFALALFVLGVVTIGYALFYGFRAQGHTLDVLSARLLAEEGLVAFKIFAAEEENVQPGTYGVGIENGVVQLTEGSDTSGIFTREVLVSEYAEGVWRAESVVSWGNDESYSAFIYVNEHVAEWGNARDLEVDLTSLSVSASSTEVLNILLQNTGDESLTVTHVAVENTIDAHLYRIDIGELDVFSVPQEYAVESGVALDTRDAEIDAGTAAPLSLFFDQDMAGAQLLIVLTLDDGSKEYIRLAL